MPQQTQQHSTRRVWTVFDVHNTSVVYVRKGFYATGSKVLDKGDTFNLEQEKLSDCGLKISSNAIQDQYRLWAAHIGKKVGDLTADDKLDADEHFVMKGLDQLLELELRRVSCISVSGLSNTLTSSPTYIVPIAGAKEAYLNALESYVDDQGVQNQGCIAVISSSKTAQSSRIVRHLLGREAFERYIYDDRLVFVNAVRPNRELTRTRKIFDLPEFHEPLSKKDPNAWLVAYMMAGITEDTPLVRIYEDIPDNLSAAFEAAKKLGHKPQTYKSLLLKVTFV